MTEMVSISKAEYEDLLAAKKQLDLLTCTESNENLNQIHFIQSLIDAIPIPIFYKDAETRFLSFNREYEAVFDTKREDLIGKTVLDLDYLTSEDRKLYQEEDSRAIKNSLTISREQLMPYSDGRLHSTLYYVSGFKDLNGKPAGLVGVFIDVSEINEARLKAEELANTKSQFLANMSHEIRTPLNGVIGLNSLLLRTNLNPTQKEYVEKSINSSKLLLGIINDILDYSKIEAGKLELAHESFCIEKLLKQSTFLFEAAVAQKHLEIHIDYDPKIPCRVKGDPLRLSQIVNNLLGNAVKFTNEGDITLAVKLQSLEGDKAYLNFSVEDTGIGISKENICKLFDSFSQVDSSHTRRFMGTGLGLNISQKLVQKMGGEIKVVSKENQGSTFSFSLELEVDHLATSPKLIDYQNNTFMVVDDNSIEREIINKILQSKGVEPIICSSGFEAIEKAQKTQIDYLIIDWKMPGLDGFETIKKMQKLGVSPKCKTLMMTAFDKEEISKYAITKDVMPDKILTKPIVQSSLSDALLDDLSDFDLDPDIINFEFDGKILVAEDNETNQMVVSEILTQMGLVVDIAENGSIAVEMYRKHSYDLILMDLQMPVMDGFEATRIIRKENPTIPIIALSAAVMDADFAKTAKAQMNAHLAKPIEINKLTFELVKYLDFRTTKKDKAIEKTESLKPIAGIEMARLESIYSDPEKIVRILQTFNKMAEEMQVNLLLESNSFYTDLHKLKGGSANIGANEIYKACLAIEKETSKNKIETLLKTLLSKLANLHERINESLESFAPESGDQRCEFSLAELVLQLEELEQRLKDSEFIDVQEVEKLVQNLGYYLAEKDLLEALVSAINDFEYEEALQALEQIQQHFN